MKIAFISPFIYKYRRGVENFTMNLTAWLVKKECLVSIIAWDEFLRPKSNKKNKIRIAKVPYTRYYQKYLASLWYLFYFLINRTNIINIFFTWHGEAVSLYILTLFRRQKFNIILPNPLSQIPHRISQYKRFNLHKKANAIIVRSNFAKGETERIFGREAKVISNGVDARHFKPDDKKRRELREQYRINEEVKIFLTVSAFERRKGIKEFIEAINLLEKFKNRMRYFIVGEIADKVYYEEIKEIVNEMDLVDMVRIFPSTSNILPFYQCADFFTLLSSGEGCPNAFLEAISCGLPVLVANEPPFIEYPIQEFGFLAERDNPRAIAERVTLLLENKELSIKMKKKAREYAIRYFSWNIIADKYYQLFRSQV